MTRTEELVYELSKKSFLSFWCYPNPQREDNKELCDILIYCEPHVIIISVKEIAPTDSGDAKTDWERWRKAAIEKSTKQIYGAERHLKMSQNLHLDDGTELPIFVEHPERKYHRIGVAIGGEEKMPLMWGDFGKGYIHIFDELSLQAIMIELDTISDLVNYLSRKEDLFTEQNQTDFLLEGGEEDLLAFYLTNDESFNSKADLLVLDSTMWSGLIASGEYSGWKKFIEKSYFWDEMIELLIKDYRAGRLINHIEYEDFDSLIRTMALETRKSRAEMSHAFADFFKQTKIRSRFTKAESGVCYVFLAPKRDEERDYRQAELIGRCLIVRKYTPESKVIVGIATEKRDKVKGFTFDHVFMDLPTFPKDLNKKIEQLVKDTGWFRKITRT